MKEVKRAKCKIRALHDRSSCTSAGARALPHEVFAYIYIYIYILIDDFLASKSVKKKYHLILPSISYQYYHFLKFKLLIWSFNN